MPDSVIKKVESLGHHAQENTFDFANRHSILFEWNNAVDKQQEGLVEEDLVPYPSLAMEFPGVFLDHDISAIKDKIIPQGCVEDAAAQNANLALLEVVTGVDAPVNVSAHDDEFKYKNNNDDIIAVANITQGGAPQLQPVVKINNPGNNANNGNNDDDSSNDANDSIGDDNESIKTSFINSDKGNQNNNKKNDGNKNNETTGLRRSKRKDKGRTDRFSDYSLFMAARQQARVVRAKPQFTAASYSSWLQT
jgi:hypothetical protein